MNHAQRERSPDGLATTAINTAQTEIDKDGPRLCTLCRPLRIQEIPRGGFRVEAKMHPTFAALQGSAVAGCPVCRVFMAAILQSAMRKRGVDEEAARQCHLEMDESTKGGFVLSAEWIDLYTGGDSSAGGCVGLDITRLGTDVGFEARLDLTSRSGCHESVVGRQLSSFPPFDLALAWIRECSQAHHRCRTIDDQPLPTRVIDVGSPGTSEPKLLFTRGMKGRYLTLSHCWGSSQPYVTNTANYAQHLHRLPVQSLPRTFRDAIEVAQTLGFQYLWIDCLCIIQGDRGDWDHECARMDEIYEKCALTIAGPAADDCYSGILHPRQRPSVPSCAFPDDLGSTDATSDLVIGESMLGRVSSSAPKQDGSLLATRAWAFQERILSPRVLFFGSKQLYWECTTTEYYEYCWYATRFNASTVSPYKKKEDLSLLEQSNRALENDDLRRTWRKVVEAYIECRLSMITDKLPALSGLARRFTELLEDTYLCGLFYKSLIKDLLWLVIHSRPHPSWVSPPCSKGRISHLWTDNKRPYTAPSWSWASGDWTVQYSYSNLRLPYTPAMKIRDVQVKHSGTNKFGEVAFGLLKVRGRTMRLSEVLNREWVPDEENDLIQDNISWFLLDRHHTIAQGYQEKVLCILAIIGENENKGWVALAIEPVATDSKTYQRVGIVLAPYGPVLNLEALCEKWKEWRQADMQTIDIV